MEGNEERPVIEAARPNLANMTRTIVKPDIMGHFELKQYMKKNDDRTFNKFLSMLSQVQLNIPLVDVLRDPKYAKYINDIVAHKRRFTEFEIVALTEECTSLVQNKLPQKIKDPGSFTILVRIGNIGVGHAFCDLGESINLIPLSLFKKLGLGTPRPTTVMLQLVDRSIAYPEGVIEDVLLPSGPPPKPSIEEAPKLELRPLPLTFNMLIWEEKLLRVLREHKQAIKWTMSDIRGISPALYMHKILMEEGNKPSVEQQRRLYPIMKELVRKEVIKWLDAYIVFSICDSKWIAIALDTKRRPHLRAPMTRMHSRECPLVSVMHLRVFKGVRWLFLLTWYLGHKVSKSGLQVDKAKVEAIEKLPPPTSIKGIHSFLGHAGFYHCFIKDFSKISSPMCRLLEKGIPFKFDDACLKAYEDLTERLVTAPIIIAPDWAHPFELMCDASDITIKAVLGKMREKFFHSIYYASKTLNPAQMNYTITEKELLAVVWAFDKFRSYLVGPKSVSTQIIQL
ncbi:uncharacterized protein [Nicotiana sylvestris]|uniref:uncharacterized protein n=1 Tax=Nicotiana sylvestris TaxID=4096 RepID=UPI00388CC82C